GTGAGGRPPEWRARAAARGRGPRPRLRRLQSGAALHIHGAQHGREERAPAWAARQRLCAQGTPATGDATRTHRAARSPTQHHARPRELVPASRARTVHATSSAPSYESAHRALAARPAGRTRHSPPALSTTPVRASSYLCAELVRCTLRARHTGTSRRTRWCAPADATGARRVRTRRSPPAPGAC